jgi:hypothetical protein
MGEIIDFPIDRIDNPLALPHSTEPKDKARFVFQQIVFELHDQGYNVKDPDLQKDLGTVLNITHAVICRADGKHHFLSELIDELNETIANIKESEI